jgi:glyoxylase-like metal-dependent hydrolase (beta-lactamase superfamily II)
MDQQFQILAIKYATVDRIRKDNFLKPVEDDPEKPMALDFFVWLVIGHGTALLVDTGFSPASAAARNRQYLITPLEALRGLGFAPEEIKDVMITHLHYDHAGNISEFPKATLWIQEREVRYATGDCMCDPKQNHFFSADDLGSLIKQLYHGNVRFINGSHQFCDGIELHHVGGHTDGLQVLRVRTAKGWVVLASDAAHYYENLAKENPFPAIYSLEDMLKGYSRIRELADGEDNIVPGHDPQVCLRFPAVGIPGITAYQIA